MVLSDKIFGESEKGQSEGLGFPE